MDETTALLYSSPKPNGIIPAQSTAEVPMVITPRALEEIDTVAEFSIFGSVQPPLVSSVILGNTLRLIFMRLILSICFCPF